MTRKQASARAHEIWGKRQTPGVNSIGDRVGTTTLRSLTSNPLVRFEVGYYETMHVSPGHADRFDLVIKGRGASWDDAFLDAIRTRANRGAA